MCLQLGWYEHDMINIHTYIHILYSTYCLFIYSWWSLILQQYFQSFKVRFFGIFSPGLQYQGVTSNVSGGIQWVDPFGCWSGRTRSAQRWRCPLGMASHFLEILWGRPVFFREKPKDFCWWMHKASSSFVSGVGPGLDLCCVSPVTFLLWSLHRVNVEVRVMSSSEVTFINGVDGASNRSIMIQPSRSLRPAETYILRFYFETWPWKGFEERLYWLCMNVMKSYPLGLATTLVHSS